MLESRSERPSTVTSPLARDLSSEPHVTPDLKPIASKQRGRPVGEARFEIADEAVALGVERHRWRLPSGFDETVFVDRVDVRAQDQQVLGGLHRREPPSRHLHHPRPLKRFERRPGGLLEVEHRIGTRILRISRLRVRDRRERKESLFPVQRVAKGVKTQPEVVGVEVAIALVVPEGGLVLGGALRRLPKHQLSVGSPAGQVASLPILGRAPDDFHQETCTRPDEVGKERRVGATPDVVHIREEGVAEPIREQIPQHSAGAEGRIEIPVPRRTPLKIRSLGNVDRSEVALAKFGRLVLQEAANVLVPQVLANRGVGRETVHEDRAHPRRLGLFQRDVQESHSLGGIEERLRSPHSHGGPESAVEGDGDGARPLFGGSCLAERRQFGDVRNGDDGLFRNVARPAGGNRHRAQETATKSRGHPAATEHRLDP